MTLRAFIDTHLIGAAPEPDLPPEPGRLTADTAFAVLAAGVAGSWGALYLLARAVRWAASW
ncbi:hypothetical protein M0638_27610 [Roseomonas sp. NAR14]|uniref:Uncharacterized protein n=1 Tax=Roseomonas acroporae TaxID=2937791 RepID=A0A9X2BWY0_9PROT|nr:hypothetical protein [Roseomonas acroporae]MCK8788127.1 hypothetical protein [Roseomonas acroporae]